MRHSAAARELTERDSAGIHIVESESPAWPADRAWTLGDAPIVDIGDGVSEEEQLFRVQGAVPLTDATIVVANMGSSELRYYDDAGQFIKTAGGRGAGPGEFSPNGGPGRIWRRPSDSVAVWDFTHRRVSFFDNRGVYARSVTLPVEGDAFPDVIGVLSGNGLLIRLGSPIPFDLPAGSAMRTVFTYAVSAPDGRGISNFAELPGTERVAFEWNGRTMTGVGPFARTTRTTVRGDIFYYTSADAFEIHLFDVTSDTRLIVRILSDPVSVSATDIADYKAERMANAPNDPDGRRAWQAWLEDIPYPTQFPTLNGLLVDTDGNLWAERFNTPADSIPKWMVFDADGRWLGTVELPRAFEPRDIGHSYVLGLWRDPDEVEHLQLYDLVKPGV